MKVTTTKTVRTTVNVKWNSTITDDNGKVIARMNGHLDAGTPLGSATLFAVNDALYKQNANAVKEAYAEFQEMVQTAAENSEAAGSSVTQTLD